MNLRHESNYFGFYNKLGSQSKFQIKIPFDAEIQLGMSHMSKCLRDTLKYLVYPLKTYKPTSRKHLNIQIHIVLAAYVIPVQMDNAFIKYMTLITKNVF